MTKQSYIKTTGIILCLALVCILALAAVSVFATTPKDTAYAAWSGSGNGTADDPYQISTPDELKKFRDIVNGANGETANTAACAILKADIDVSDEEWTPIADYNTSTGYEGVFDGDKHTVTISINASTVRRAFFRTVKGNGVVKKLTIAGTVTSSKKYAAGIVAYLDGGTIKDCVNRAAITSTYNDYSYVGGIAGHSENGATINRCYNDGPVVGYATIGGIVGYNKALVSDCYNIGDVGASDGHVDSAGGIAGSNDGTIINCFQYGTVSITWNKVGGITSSSGGTAQNTYYLQDSIRKSGVTYHHGLGSKNDEEGVTKEMTAEEFRDATNFAGFDFTFCWEMGADHPVFKAGTGAAAAAEAAIDLIDEDVVFPDSRKEIEAAEEVLDRLSESQKDLIPNIGTLRNIEETYAQLRNEWFSRAGTPEDPYLIHSLGELEVFRDITEGENGETRNLAASAKLLVDIELTSWTPIVKTSYSYNSTAPKYVGTFDGNGHTVTYNLDGDYEIFGLFGFVGAGGVIKDLITEGSITSSGSNVSAIAYRLNGKILRCVNHASITAKEDIGGIVNYASGGSGCEIRECYNTGTLTAASYIGGIVVDIRTAKSTIRDCYNVGNINIIDTVPYSSSYTFTEANVGGIAGYFDAATIRNCFNYGEIRIQGDPQKEIIYAGNITGSCDGEIYNTYYLENTLFFNEEVKNGGMGGGNGMQPKDYIYPATTTKLTAEGFRSIDSFTGFSFTEVWHMGEDHPLLKAFLHEVVFHPTNGENDLTKVVPHKEKVTSYTPTREDSTFDGWYADEECTEAFDFDTLITEDTDLYAKWIETEYTIDYVLNGGTNHISNPSIYKKSSDTITLQDPTKDGYEFLGWTTEGVTTPTKGMQIASGSKGNKTFTANWEIINYSITYTNAINNENGVTNTNPSTYTIETSTFALDDPTRMGYTFTGWTEADTTVAQGSTGDKTFTANWTLNAPSLSAGGYSGTYDGVKHLITVMPTHALDVEYSYRWKKGDEVLVNATTATLSVKDVTQSGTYTVTVTAATDEAEAAADQVINVSITQIALSVTAKPKTISYGDAPANDGVTYAGLAGEDAETVLSGELVFDYTYTQYGHVSDGSHAYTLTPGGLTSENYVITFNSGVLTVIPKAITVTIVSKTSAYGDAQVELTATTSQGAIENGDALPYTLYCEVTETSDADHYDITGTNTNENYSITFENEEDAYEVTPRVVTINWSDKDGYVYDKTAHKPTATAENLVNGDEVALVVVEEYVNAGVGHVATAAFAIAQSNYALPTDPTTTFDIAEKPITVTIVGKTSVYGDEQVELTATTEQGAIEDGDTDPFALTCAVTAASNVGFYDIIGTETSTNYDVSFVGESDAYEVTVRTITIAWSHTNDLVYNKTAQKPTATAENLKNNDVVALTVSGEQTNAGTGYLATASFAAAQTNYVLPDVVTTNFAIAEKPITVTIVNKTSVYGEAQVALTATTEQGAIEDGDQNVYSLACEVTATSDVGSYDITGTDTSDNYAVSFLNEDNAYSVTQKALTVTAKAKTITYGDAPANDGVTYQGFVNSQDESVLTGTIDYAYTYSQYGHVSDDTHAYSITPKGYDLSNGNYALTFVPATLSVEPKNIVVTVEKKQSVYGETPAVLTATNNGIVNGDRNVYSLACDVTAASPVGSYDITGVDTSDNYVVSFANEENAYSVTPRTITIAWTHTNDLVYNKSAQKPVATAGNLVNNDNVALTVADEQINAGTGYVATASFAVAQTNYVLPDVVTTNFAIAEKPITVTIIGKTSVYGEEQVALTATTEQGAIEDGDADPYTLECEVTTASNVGFYDIIGTYTSTNYAVTFANEEGAYAVTKKTLTVTVDDKSIKYAEDVPEFTLVVTGVVDGNDDPAEIKSTILENSTMTSTAVDGNTSGKYAISFAFDEGENEDTVLDDYTIEYTNGVLTIAKRLENGGIRAEGLDPDKDYEIKRDDEDGDNDNEKDVGIKITIKNDPDDDDDDEDYTGEAELIIDVPEPIDPDHFDLYKEDENGETSIDPDDYDVEDGRIIIETKLPVKFVLKNRKGQIYVQVNDASIHDGDDIPTYSYTVTGWEQQGGGLTADEINAAKNAVQALATSYTVGQTGQFDIDPSFKTGYTEYTVVDGFRVRLTGGILSVLPKILRDKTVEVTLENEEDAFDLDISVEVEIKTANEAKKEEGIDYDAVSAKFVDRRSEISAVYSVKLLRTETVNGVETITEIQPSEIKPGSDTTIIVKMEIPEHLTGRSFRILHIHSANDIEYVDSSKIEIKDGYVYAKVNRLSEFAFVNLKDAEEMDHHGFCLGWLVVIFDILVAVYFAVYMLLKRKKLLNIIGLGVSGAVLVFALIVLILHICIVSIIGFVLAVLLFAAFLTFFFIDKKGDDSKQKCDKTQKIESKKENAQGNVATTTTTQTVIETDNEATAVVPVAVIEESEDEEEEGEDGGVVVDASGNIFNIRYKKSFLAKLIQSPDVTKQYYTALKNEVLAYNKTKSRVSWAYDSVNAGRTQLLKFSVRGKTLCVYFALNADDYIDSKYKVEKAEAAKYESVSCMYRIKNDRRAKYAIDLIATVCAKYGLTKGEVPTEDYYLPYETTEALIGKGLIKELKTVATDEQIKRAKAAGKIKYVSHVSVSEANEMISDEVAATLIEEKRIGSAVGKKDIVNVDVLSKNYNDGDTVTIDNLKTKKLVPQSAKQVKLLARGTLDKKLHIELQDYSIEAVKMVIATGGTVKRV